MANPLETLWHDTMDIYRYNDDDSLPDTPTHAGVKCHYSMKTVAAVGTDAAPELVNQNKLFCAPDVDIRPGDYVEVTQRNGTKVNLTVGEGFPYTCHQEFSVTRSDHA
jgi:hypothetical protein